MAEVWKCVTVHTSDGSDLVRYRANNQQQFTRANVIKSLPEEHIEIIRENGFDVTIHDDRVL